MNNNYSLDVSRIFKSAEVISQELNHPYVGTEHLVLSMLQSDDNIKNVLNDYGLEYNEFLEELISLVGRGKGNITTCIYTPLLKRVISKALEIAGKGSLNSFYLLESLLLEGEGIAIRIMLSLGIDIDLMYEDLKLKSGKSKKKLEIYNIGKDLSLNESDEVIIGREKEISLVMETLLRKNKNNPLLIGDAGVGKSAIVEEIARRIKKGDVPKGLIGKKIISLEMSSLVSGTKYRGEFEEKLGKIIKEVEENPEIILFIDEIHTISNAGGAEGAINASDTLKPYLARGKIKLIGATTAVEYNKFILKDKALARRFEVIKVCEPNEEQTREILLKIKPSFEKHYNIKISEDNINYIVLLTSKYILNRFNPDKSIDLLDSVCSMKMVSSEKNLEISKLNSKLKETTKKKEKMVKNNNFEEALKLRSLEIDINRKIESMELGEKELSNEDIKNVMLRNENVPKISGNFNGLEEYLKKKIIGQDEVIEKIIDTLKIGEEDRPTSILLTGQTGVGKTETVKLISKYLDMHLIRLDLSEYSDSSSITRLIGSSAGYVGYNDESIFDRVKMYPCSIILLDEVEKASPSVLNLFLQILDEGFITNSCGEKIDFQNTYIFMTSNASEGKKIGFVSNKGKYEESFSKEFLARISLKVNFNDISKDILKKYLEINNINDEDVIKDYDYESLGLRGIKKYLKK